MKSLRFNLSVFSKFLNYSKQFMKMFQNQFVLKQILNKEDVKVIKWLEEKNYMESDWYYANNGKHLPKLPLPPLQQTLKKYEEKMSVLLNEEDYSHLKNLTKIFVEDENLGPRLQTFLFERQKKLDNWAYDYWLDDMYLANKVPLPIYSSPGYINKSHTKVEDICCLGTHIVCLAVMMESMIKLNMFPRESKKKPMSGHLCTDQYLNIFNSIRIPGKEKDFVNVYNSQDKKHIIVIYQNNFYYVPINISKNRIDKSTIYSSLKSIINNVSKHNSSPIGILTTLGRRKWWETRNILKKNSINQQNLQLIEKALFIICLDKPISEKSKNDNHTLLLLKQSMHGGNVDENSGNRWYDKTLQIILSESHVGFCFEHSLLDGIVVNTLFELLFNYASQTSKFQPCRYNKFKPNVVKLNWVLESDMLKRINRANLIFDRFVKDLDLQIWTFNNYGSKFIKFHKYGPDGFVQLILQLTYYKMYQKLCATYESASTRRFKKGRIDCIRASTPEVFEWVKEMVKSETVNAVKLKLWKNAINAHYKESNDVTLGQGIDVHLLGLREAAKEILDKVPELFTDQTYSKANKFTLSTSQVGNIKNVVWGFGPVVDDGYGVFYTIQSNSIEFAVSSFYSCNVTSTTKFLNFLEESLCVVKTLIEYA